jgi:predicted MFS family arabinose efflux permease
MGVTELSWAASLAVAAPLTGYLLGVNGLRPVYLMLFLANALGFVMVALFTLPDAPGKDSPARESLLKSWRILLKHPAALAAIAYTLCLIIGNEMILIVYGDWMESSFDLELAALGTVTIVIAVAEVIGEFVVIGVSDRIGKRRLALAGTLVASIGCFTLTQLGFSLFGAQIGLFVVFVAIETAIVSSLPLFSEVLPEARAVMLSANVAAHALARFGGGVFGSQLYRLTDFKVTGLAAMAIGLLGFVIMWFFIVDHDHDEA